ncbi:hypothetical protein K439DRAFT_1371074, partial [Ramaria rubella]
FTMVSAFFLFSIGCLNNLMVKSYLKNKRSFTSWKETAKSMLPSLMQDVCPVFTPAPPSFVFNLYMDTSNMQDTNISEVGEKTGTGFGCQLESTALTATTTPPPSPRPPYSQHLQLALMVPQGALVQAHLL